MDQETDGVLREISGRIDLLQNRYHLYRGALFRAIIRPEGIRPDCEWTNILATFRLSDSLGQPGLTKRTALGDGLELLEVFADPRGLPPWLRAVVEEEKYAFAERFGKQQVSLKADPESGVRFQAPEFLTSENFGWNYGERHGGLVYFLDTGSPLGELGLSHQSMARLGFRDFRTLLWHHLFTPDGETPENMPLKATTGIHIILPNNHAKLEQVLIEGSVVRARISTRRKVPLRDFRLVLEAYTTSPGRFGRTMIQAPRIWERLSRREVVHEYPSPPHYVDARLYWNLGRNDVEMFVDEQRSQRADLVLYPQLAIHRHFDPDLRRIEEALRTRTQSKDFEWAVATLLALSGFQVDWLGYKGSAMQGDIDIVAYWPRDKLAVLGECTLAGADLNRKITDLTERAQEIAESLEGWEIRKVLFTTLSWAGIQASQKAGAEELEIALVTKESLPSLLKAVESAIPPVMLWERLKPQAHSPLELADL